MRIANLALALVLLGIPALAAAQGNAGSEMTAHQILSGNERGVTRAGHEIVRSQQQFEDLLQSVYAGQVAPTAPQVDFSRQVLVYYSLGTATRGGVKLIVRSGRLEHGVLHVSVEIAEPAATCLGTDSLTAPFALAALPFPAHDVRRADFEVTRKSYPCK